MAKDSYTHSGREKLPEPKSEPCELERVVNRPYEGTKQSTTGLKELSKGIGKPTGDK